MWFIVSGYVSLFMRLLNEIRKSEKNMSVSKEINYTLAGCVFHSEWLRLFIQYPRHCANLIKISHIEPSIFDANSHTPSMIATQKKSTIKCNISSTVHYTGQHLVYQAISNLVQIALIITLTLLNHPTTARTMSMAMIWQNAKSPAVCTEHIIIYATSRCDFATRHGDILIKCIRARNLCAFRVSSSSSTSPSCAMLVCVAFNRLATEPHFALIRLCAAVCTETTMMMMWFFGWDFPTFANFSVRCHKSDSTLSASVEQLCGHRFQFVPIRWFRFVCICTTLTNKSRTSEPSGEYLCNLHIPSLVHCRNECAISQVYTNHENIIIYVPHSVLFFPTPSEPNHG